LYLSRDAEHWEQAYGESETRFFAQGDDTRFVFVKDADGKISGLNIEMQGLVIPAQKVD
jgi:hypothetical protein